MVPLYSCLHRLGSVSSSLGISVCRGDCRPEEASSYMGAGPGLGGRAQLAAHPVFPACENLLSPLMFTCSWRRRARWVLFAVLSAQRFLLTYMLWGGDYLPVSPHFPDGTAEMHGEMNLPEVPGLGNGNVLVSSWCDLCSSLLSLVSFWCHREPWTLQKEPFSGTVWKASVVDQIYWD